jgi:hypothetical protein
MTEPTDAIFLVALLTVDLALLSPEMFVPLGKGDSDDVEEVGA